MTADNDIVERLRALSRCEHSDLSVGDEAAAEIVRLRGEAESMEQMARMQAARADAAEREVTHLRSIASAEAKVDAFADWLAREMPPGTVISNPRWWAPRILRAIERNTPQPAEAKTPAPAMPNGVEGYVTVPKTLTTDMLEAGEQELAMGNDFADAWEAAIDTMLGVPSFTPPPAPAAVAGGDAEEDAYVIDALAHLLAEISIIVNGPEPAGTKWSYHDLPAKVAALKGGAK